ncbi:MAG TPA: hypothetical protein VH682_07760 [Gemmataceae bacterium]|jgi:hypothetical protein
MKSVQLLGARLRVLLIPALLVLGLGLRSYHYLRDRVVWQDEAGLLLTVTARGFGDLFRGQLDYHQAAPPLYLCVLKTVSLVLGDSSHALRLPSFLAGCAALLLFVPVARCLLVPQAVPWALLLFAGSEQLLWHASEAKAYSVDVLAAVLVLAVPCCGRLASLRRQLLAYTLLAPVLLLSSYPACFLCVGLLFAYLPAVLALAFPKRLTQRRKDAKKDQKNQFLSSFFLCVFASLRESLLWLALLMTIGVTLLWLLLGPVRCQHDAEIHSCWVACMPDWHRPWTVPGWLLLAPFEMCRYCCKPLGQVLALLAVPGTLVLWRCGERTMVRLMLAPILLALLAACAQCYPFGGARVMAYTTPAILLLAAAGVPPVFAWLNPRLRLVSVGLVALLVLPLLSSLEKVVHTWREADIPAAAAFVQAQRHGDDLILGNDVAQQYYFRHLGRAFHLLDDTPLPSPCGDRLWVVMTASLPRSERVRMASQLAPAGWHARRQHEFAFTTVILFSR